MRITEANPILQNLLSDIAAQPPWRGAAAVDMAWRDNIQWTKEQREYYESLGLPKDLFVNLMAAAIDAVTGHEAKHQVDWMIIGADEAHDEMAEAINHKLNDVMRLSDANHACSEAYESQACVGIGWVHVCRNPDLLGASKYLIEDVHRDEMFWDMRSRSEDLRRDCRWVARRRFFDHDEAKSFLPGKYHELVDYTYSDSLSMDISEEGIQYEWFADLSEYTDPIDLIMDNNSERKRIAIYEVYYKVFEKRDLIAMPGGMMTEFKPGNPIHLEMLATMQASLHKSIPVNVVRVAWFVGPHIIYDGPSSAPHNHFPYIPFFGPREDSTNAPTGLLRRMRGPQEQYNRAVVEIQRILRSRRIEKDSDALIGMNDQQAVFEINRSDGVINLKAGRKFQVIREWEKIAVLERICERARGEINAASGIYQTFQGQTEASQSGIAVESIAELGAQTLGKINANYQLGRKMVGDLVFSYLVEDIGVNPEVVKIPQQIGQAKKMVVLNDGINNRVATFRGQVALQPVHTSAGYRQHAHQRITGIIDKMPDDFKPILLPFWIESSDMPKKEQAMKLINKKLGYEEDENKRAEMEAQQENEAQQQKEMETRALLADIAEKEASAKDKKAQANNHLADALKKRVETAKLLREFKLIGSPGQQAGSGSADQEMQGGQADHLANPVPRGIGRTEEPAQQYPVAPHPDKRLQSLSRETTL